MTPNPKTPVSLHRYRAGLLLAAAIVAAGPLAFLAGRATSPTPPAVPAPAAESPVSPHGDEDREKEGHEGETSEHGAEAIAFEAGALKSAGIRVAPVTLTAGVGAIPFNGQIEASPNRIVRVASVVPGRVTQLLVSVGDRVQRGQTVAIVESRAVGEAQSAYRQAAARAAMAEAALKLVSQQARAGVFANAPLEAARRTRLEALAETRTGENTVRHARIALDNVLRQTRLGSFSSPPLEAARTAHATATAALGTAEAALGRAGAEVQAANSELERRRQFAANGSYAARPVEEARRLFVAAQSARAAAQSETATARANLDRARSLAAEGLVSRREQETAGQASDTAASRLVAAQSDETTAKLELDRQQKLAGSNVAANAEIGAAQSALAAAKSGVRAHGAELDRTRKNARLAAAALARERSVFTENIANRREVSAALGALESARVTAARARGTLAIADATLRREHDIFRRNLNDISQVQVARSAAVLARSEVAAARTALALLKSAPGGVASVPVRAPIAGTVQERPVARGEVLAADAHLMTIADLSVVHVDMFIPERDIARVHLGASANISVDALPGRAFSGRIELIHTELDAKTRTVEAHAEVANHGELRVGMFARGHITASSGRAALTVPASAVQTLEDRQVVFVQAARPTEFVAREIQIGETARGRTTVKRGLKLGERIVVQGAFMVKAQAMKAELGHEH